MTPPDSRRVLRPWWFALAAAGVMLFIAYGSYVPFEVQPRAWGDATAAFREAMGRWASPGSRSDFVANIALGVPLGFCLLGALRVDRRGWRAAVVAGVPVVLAGGLFAAAVEFGQLYVRGRVCSGADITAQSLGAAVGVLGWVVAGQWLTERVRRVFDADAVRGSTAPLLVAYAGLLLLVQTLPLDLTASPYDLYHRLKEKTAWVPFGELTGRSEDPPTLAVWCEEFGLYLPAGLLLAGLRGAFGRASGWPWAVGLGLLAAMGLELCQVLVVSRHPSTTDVLIGGAGVTAGWLVARLLAGRRVSKSRTRAALLCELLWAVLLATVAWHPYQFSPGVFGERLGAMNWLPLREAVQGPYLWAAEDLLAKFALFLPLGAVARWGRCPVWASAGVCGLVAVVLELGQGMLPTRTVCPTDVLAGMAGGWVGAAVGRTRVHTVGD